jgi:hypothetical protein
MNEGIVLRSVNEREVTCGFFVSILSVSLSNCAELRNCLRTSTFCAAL